MTDSVDWERELMRARELMVQTSRDALDDAAKIQIFLEACSLAESLVYGHRIGDHARADLQAYAEQMRQREALDWLMDSLYCLRSDGELLVHLQLYVDQALAAILRQRYIAEERAGA